MTKHSQLQGIIIRTATSVKPDSRVLGLGYSCQWFAVMNPEAQSRVADKGT